MSLLISHEVVGHGLLDVRVRLSLGCPGEKFCLSLQGHLAGASPVSACRRQLVQLGVRLSPARGQRPEVLRISTCAVPQARVLRQLALPVDEAEPIGLFPCLSDVPELLMLDDEATGLGLRPLHALRDLKFPIDVGIESSAGTLEFAPELAGGCDDLIGDLRGLDCWAARVDAEAFRVPVHCFLPSPGPNPWWSLPGHLEYGFVWLNLTKFYFHRLRFLKSLKL